MKEDEIDPRYFETPYYLVPGKGGENRTRCSAKRFAQPASVGIGKIIIRQTQHLAGIKVVGDALVLEIMRFANELVEQRASTTFPSAKQCVRRSCRWRSSS